MPTKQATRERRTDDGRPNSLDPKFKWVRVSDAEPDHKGQTLATRDHDVIRRWAEERGGRPATTSKSGRPSVLRVDFPGYGGQDLRKISWDDWFSVFDDRQVTFLFQENLKDGRQSNFSRLTRPTD